ncbi:MULTISPECIES: TraR/DksA C4-type zinc finger protein [unclassified Paenibacillus]|uniref:TraR/DksA C4-type zinc finger protein n=1 Tax=unclassified Paenibacillus TaxID=185978 RepID=UPI001AEB89B4|nr:MULTISPECIES: TraR/DksA C4-type zinc finger protein [unclassified Paenibacillus]MBP1156260.1 YteA family regulatory protein [Paenibacillus sp. PvP091]MBP1168354.1 YteA family regulatory protein [Paenibacillus sp. PvR098]MBP2439382.1 YteA family regulatory protein [Paenibacillus sp. PvP052]
MTIGPLPSHSLTVQQLKQLTDTLREEKRWLEEHLKDGDHFGLGDSMRVQTGELSTNDNHPADLGTEMFERGKDIALNENAERHLADANEALQRIEDGTYGVCRNCGTPIPFERLQAVPTAAYCVEHVPDPHSSDRRPVEEQLLAPPFGRTSLDELPEQNQFDGEDAWQIVESWGTSNSPAMAENPNESDSYNEMEIEADETVGYVEPFESFLATDIYGQHVTVVRNKAYKDYMRSGEGYGLLEPELNIEDEHMS